MMSSARPRALLLAAATGLCLVLSACGGDDAPESEAAPTADASTSETSAAPAVEGPFGTGCGSSRPTETAAPPGWPASRLDGGRPTARR